MVSSPDPTMVAIENAIDPALLAGAKVLVVDDLRSSRMLIGSILSAAGFSNAYASDGAEALQTFKSFEPDILILDLVMPGMDGYEVCREVRETLKSDIPILVQSGVQEAGQRARAFDVGASDMVTKPINAAEMLSRLRLHLERERLVSSLRGYQRMMEDELRTAEAMQIDLLPTVDQVTSIAGPRGVRIQSHYQPSNRLGGDLWDAFSIDDDRFGVYMVDFSGHGVTAAINAFRLHMLTEAATDVRERPAEWLAHISTHLYRILPVQHFATAVYGVYDRRTGQFEYATAAAPEPFVLRADGQVDVLDTAGLLLGCSDSATYETRSIQLNAGDQILFYSDAMVENFADPDSSLTPEQLAEHARTAMKDASLEGFCPRLIDAVFKGEADAVTDDLTLIFMEIA
jgi:sigma-B regulation protein RsbU (phosphoserine phosphatase)